MKRAETAFSLFANHCVISHLHHAKKLVPFKTFSPTADKKSSELSSDFFGGIAFGSNVFLRCHTDADFTMSITQVFLKGPIISSPIFVFLAWEWQFLFVLVITLCLMLLFPIVFHQDATWKMRLCAPLCI
jgi:hypothetical protein